MPARSTLAPATRPVDEKLTINIGCVDLGQIDLLVQEGFYANRTDLIRTAIRNQLTTHGDAVRRGFALCLSGASLRTPCVSRVFGARLFNIISHYNDTFLLLDLLTCGNSVL